MVFFTCNLCGDALKKNKVDQHTYQCRTNSLSCVDCLKDFNLKSYASHLECITEDQKYGGANFQQQEFKGKNKQNDWVQKIKFVISENKFPNDIQNILKSLVHYDNIPRKKPKFSNFVKNSFRIRDEQLISKIWNIFETSIKDNKPNPAARTNCNNHPVNEENGKANVSNGVKRSIETEKESVETNSEKKIKADVPEEKLKMKTVVKTILTDKELSVSKLRKKVLKFYHKKGYEDDEAILRKFEKIIYKKKFVINDNLITLAH